MVTISVPTLCTKLSVQRILPYVLATTLIPPSVEGEAIGLAIEVYQGITYTPHPRHVIPLREGNTCQSAVRVQEWKTSIHMHGN